MRLIHGIIPIATFATLTTAQSFISASPISPSTIAKALASLYPNPSVALLAPPYYWWQSGSIIDALLNYFHTTNDVQYNALISNTLLSQVTGTNDFMTPDATGNDDQAWWGLAALSAAEFGVPQAQGGLPWLDYARNVFTTQKSRWNTERCDGGLKWKIRAGDAGYTYRSTISNGLFFQLAARIARFADDSDAETWAEMAYDWTVGVRLIDEDFDVFDGTDDEKGSGCVDVNHLQWSYNTGVFLYGAAVMANVTGEARWVDRASGFLEGAKRNFVREGRLFEQACEEAGTCNTDQVSFKATLARWMGGTAILLPDLRPAILEVVGNAADAVAEEWSEGAGVMEHFTALEVMDALIATGGGVVGLSSE